MTHTINEGFATGYEWEWRDVNPFNAPYQRHLIFTLHNSGRLDISASRTFWSYFCIHIPNPHYRSILYGSGFDPTSEMERFISLNPRTGERIERRIVFWDDDHLVAWTEDWDDYDASLGVTPQNNYLFQAAVSNNPTAAGEAVDEGYATSLRTMKLLCNLFSGLDQRVCIEVTTSLPLTHSALVEDNKEKPDYSLGRFMINTGIRITSNGSEERSMHGPSTYELMNSDKRIMYHRLMPQAKVSILRIQMYIRRREYDSASNSWTMKSEPLPTVNTDWWHCRLHFREIHELAISQKQSPYQ